MTPSTVISLLLELASGLSWHQVFGYMSRRCVKLDRSLSHQGKVMCLHTNDISACSALAPLTNIKNSYIAGTVFYQYVVPMSSGKLKSVCHL